MGKVASSTICRSLEKSGVLPFQVHHLSDVTSSQYESEFRYEYVSTDYIETILRSNLRNDFVRRIFLNKNKSLSKIRIISPIREPVSYLLSAFSKLFFFFL